MLMKPLKWSIMYLQTQTNIILQHQTKIGTEIAEVDK